MDKLATNNNENSFLFSVSLIFNENIDKLWLYLKDLSAESKNVDFLDNFKILKGKNTWTVGNKFSIYWIGVSNVEFICVSTSSSRMKKMLKWKCICDIGISYYKTMILYRISSDNRTLVKINITRCEKNKSIDIGPQLQYYMDLQFNILEHQSNYLQKLKKEKHLYQSFTINKNYYKIWNFIINLKNILNLFPEIMTNIEYNGQIDEIGTFIKFYHYKRKKNIFFRVVEFLNPNKRNTYKIRYETIGTENKNFPKIIEIQVNIISQIKTFVSILYSFESETKDEVINCFDINLKNLINKIKEYIKTHVEEFKDD